MRAMAQPLRYARPVCAADVITPISLQAGKLCRGTHLPCQIGSAYAVSMPYGNTEAGLKSLKPLISLARPTGIEPVFPP
jgi:hypothetical protein